MSGPRFRREVIDPDPPGSHHDVALVADLNGDGLNDVIIGARDGEGGVNLFWYENPSWTRHDMGPAPVCEAGGVLIDLTRSGSPDVVVGQQGDGTRLFWLERPENPAARWTARLVTGRFRKYHDQAAGDVDGDGETELVFLSQRAGVLAYCDIPADPRVEPWPDECLRLVTDALPSRPARNEVEGLAVVDIDGDGREEIVAGPDIYRRGDGPGSPWSSERYLEGYFQTRVEVADLDGALDIVVAEGERDQGRLAVCRAPDWAPEVLRDDLFHPHSLGIADFDGDGRADVFVAEMGLGRNPEPRMYVFLNRGGAFEEVLVQRGVPTHEAKLADLTGNGLPDIVGKPYDPERHIDVWFNEG